MSNQPETMRELIESVIETERTMPRKIIKTLATQKLRELPASVRVIFEAALGATIAQHHMLNNYTPGESVASISQTDNHYMNATGDGIFDLLRDITYTQSQRTR